MTTTGSVMATSRAISRAMMTNLNADDKKVHYENNDIVFNDNQRSDNKEGEHKSNDNDKVTSSGSNDIEYNGQRCGFMSDLTPEANHEDKVELDDELCNNNDNNNNRNVNGGSNTAAFVEDKYVQWLPNVMGEYSEAIRYDGEEDGYEDGGVRNDYLGNIDEHNTICKAHIRASTDVECKNVHQHKKCGCINNMSHHVTASISSEFAAAATIHNKDEEKVGNVSLGENDRFRDDLRTKNHELGPMPHEGDPAAAPDSLNECCNTSDDAQEAQEDNDEGKVEEPHGAGERINPSRLLSLAEASSPSTMPLHYHLSVTMMDDSKPKWSFLQREMVEALTDFAKEGRKVVEILVSMDLKTRLEMHNVLLMRQIETRKKLFGVKLFDVLSEQYKDDSKQQEQEQHLKECEKRNQEWAQMELWSRDWDGDQEKKEKDGSCFHGVCNGEKKTDYGNGDGADSGYLETSIMETDIETASRSETTMRLSKIRFHDDVVRAVFADAKKDVTTIQLIIDQHEQEMATLFIGWKQAATGNISAAMTQHKSKRSRRGGKNKVAESREAVNAYVR